jgi:mersacidin/lichenicidin family type 2 lantibiotic
MKKIDIARAFRDEDYYLSLSAAERASLPPHPAAAFELNTDQLRATSGGTNTDLSCGATPICTFCGGRMCS